MPVARDQTVELAAKQDVSSNPTHTSGTLASRPAAGSTIAGSTYYATDNGLLYILVAGAWVTAKPGQELGYAEITSSFTTASTHTTLQDVTGLTVTVTVGVRPIIVEFGCFFARHTTTGECQACIVEGSTTLQQARSTIDVADKGVNLAARVRLAPSAGSHTYKVQFQSLTVNAASILAAAATSPCWLQVTEV